MIRFQYFETKNITQKISGLHMYLLLRKGLKMIAFESTYIEQEHTQTQNH